jgi:hypothetical protein
MRSGEICNQCRAAKLKVRTTFTRGSLRVRYLFCDGCKATSKEIVTVDDIGRTVLPVAIGSKADEPIRFSDR